MIAIKALFATRAALLRTCFGFVPILILTSCVSKALYHPDSKKYFDPAELGFLHQEFFLKTEDGETLHAWRIQARNPRGTILQLHGNAQNMTAHFPSLVWLVNQGFNLITFDYRGYGRSTGSPSPGGLHRDALRMLEFARGTVLQDGTALIVYGQSLGGAVALRAVPDMAGLPRPAAVVVEGAFLSYSRIGAEKMDQFCFPPVPWLAAQLLNNDYDPRNRIKDLSPVPLIILHGTRDRVVPFHHAQEIYREAANPRVLLTMHGAGHLFWNDRGAIPFRKKFARLLQGAVEGKELNPLIEDFLSYDRGAGVRPEPLLSSGRRSEFPEN